MSFQGRSLDDLPLASYSRAVRPDGELEDDPADDVEATAAPNSAERQAAAERLAEAEAAAERQAAERQAAERQAATRQKKPAPPAKAAARSGSPTATPAAAPSPPPPAPTFAPAALGAAAIDFPDGPQRARHIAFSMPAALTLPMLRAFPALRELPPMPEWLANPRAHTRDPRLLMTGVIGVGVVLLLGSLLFGGGSNAGAVPAASASTAPVAAATVGAPSGDATVEVTGKLKGSYELLGASGTGPAAAGKIGATWADGDGSSLALAGAASSGTRKTDSSLVLTWTLVKDGEPVTFTSESGECTVGMSVQPFTVTGSFVCKKLKSDDGKVTVTVRGSYRT